MNRNPTKLQIDSDVCAGLRDCSMETGLSMTEVANRMMRKRIEAKEPVEYLVNPEDLIENPDSDSDE